MQLLNLRQTEAERASRGKEWCVRLNIEDLREIHCQAGAKKKKELSFLCLRSFLQMSVRLFYFLDGKQFGGRRGGKGEEKKMNKKTDYVSQISYF